VVARFSGSTYAGEDQELPTAPLFSLNFNTDLTALVMFTPSGKYESQAVQILKVSTSRWQHDMVSEICFKARCILKVIFYPMGF